MKRHPLRKGNKDPVDWNSWIELELAGAWGTFPSDFESVHLNLHTPLGVLP